MIMEASVDPQPWGPDWMPITLRTPQWGVLFACRNSSDGTNGDLTGFPGDRIANAHRYFNAQARDWLKGGGDNAAQTRAVAIETAVREFIQMVIIDLSVDENAQEIFETLNARGAQLSAADLIKKDFIFQRLLETGKNVEDAYQHDWKEFETGFWELEINVGRLRYPRSAIFLNHWLIARTGDEVVAREVFNRFKRYADDDSGEPMTTLLQKIHAAADVYRNFINAASSLAGPISRLGLFGYRTGVLESVHGNNPSALPRNVLFGHGVRRSKRKSPA